MIGVLKSIEVTRKVHGFISPHYVGHKFIFKECDQYKKMYRMVRCVDDPYLKDEGGFQYFISKEDIVFGNILNV